MKLHLMKWVVLVALFASCHACQGASKTDTDSETDTAGDTGQDVAEDTSQDVAGDTAEDTGQDVTGDTAEDGADVSTDDVTGEDGCAGEACTEAGDTRCADTVIETCTSDASGCLSWEPGTDCEETGDVCIGSAGVATCQCADVCPAVGGLRCASQVIERCETDADGCLDWFVHLDCGAAGGDCNVAGTGCDIPCTGMEAGMMMCLGDLVLLCDGMSYAPFEDCEESGETCQVFGAGVAACG